MQVDIKILLPVSATVRGIPLVGVYKIELDSGQFYIGSSSHLKSRAITWKGFFKKCRLNKRNEGRHILENISGCTSGIFSVIEYVSDATYLKDRESELIKLEMSNPLCLNIYVSHEKPVSAFLPDGTLVKKYKSAMWAFKEGGFSATRVRASAKDGSNIYKGMYWRYENPEHFEYKKYENRWDRWNELNPRVKKDKVVKVLQYSIDGAFIAGHFSTNAAARAVGVHKKSVYTSLRNSKRTAGGFVFKFA